ncbi:transposase [Streptosporangium sp. NPDC048047]|uniref:transposase n=1 Tax=Streptosporangium sp. NPDC048047 TaxID=3155748 RepID=UPI00341A8EB9
MSERKPYPSDLSDEQWALIEPVITAWKAAHRSVGGHQGDYAMRGIVNTILYQERTSDLPPGSATTAPIRRSTTCCAGTYGRKGEDCPTYPGRAGHSERPCGGRDPRHHDGKGREQEGAGPQTCSAWSTGASSSRQDPDCSLSRVRNPTGNALIWPPYLQ